MNRLTPCVVIHLPPQFSTFHLSGVEEEEPKQDRLQVEGQKREHNQEGV